jgi:hypothetical protein
MMDYFREPVVVSRGLLWFLFGMGIGWIVDTIGRLLLSKYSDTSNHHVDKGKKGNGQEGLKHESSGINLDIFRKEDVVQQEGVSSTQDQTNRCIDETNSLPHAPHSSKADSGGQPDAKRTPMSLILTFLSLGAARARIA